MVRLHKKGIGIVILCLLPAILMVGVSFVNKDCLSHRQVNYLFNEATHLEQQGLYSEAYLIFKKIDVFACSNSEARSEAFNRAVILSKQIDS